MAIDPSQLGSFANQAGPPPGPTADPYGPTEAQTPLGLGPVLAQLYRAIDTESRAGPNRILGAALASPIGNVLTAGAGEGTRYRIMQKAQQDNIGMANPGPGETGATSGALGDFFENTPLGAAPFMRTILTSLADPLLGVGPVARLGAPARDAIEGGIRGATYGLGALAHVPNAEGVFAPARGHLDQMATPWGGTQSMYSVSPLADWKAQAMSNVAGALNAAGLGLPGKTAEWLAKTSGISELAPMQKVREQEGRYRSLFTTIEQRTGMPFTDWYDKAKLLTDKQLGTLFDSMGLSDNDRKLFVQNRLDIRDGMSKAISAQNQVYRLGVDLLRAQNVPGLSPELITSDQKAGWPIVKTALGNLGIKSQDDLLNAYKSTFGDSYRVDALAHSLKGFDVDPLNANNSTELVLGGMLSKMRENVPEVVAAHGSKVVGSVLSKLEFLNDVQKGQAVTSIPYLANNAFQRIMGLAMYGNSTMDALINQAKGLSTGWKLDKGEFANLPIEQQRLQLFPKDVQEFMAHTGVNFPAMLEPGQMSNIFDLGPSADELTKTPAMAIEKMGKLYPAIMAGLAGASNISNPAMIPFGMLEGALAGKAGQMLAGKIKAMERIAETYGRSLVWKQETARYARDAMHVGADATTQPFLSTVLDTISGKFNNIPWEHLEANPEDTIYSDKTNPIQSVIQQAKDAGANVSDALGQFWNRNPQYKPTLAPPGAIRLNPVPQVAKRMPTPEDAQSLRQLLEGSNGLISVKDLQNALNLYAPGIGKGTINDLTRQWANHLDAASQAGEAAARKVMIIPRTNMLDEHLKYLTLFHYWATRALPWFGEQVLSSPSYTAVLLRQLADSAKEINYRGIPNRLSGASALVHPETALLGWMVHSLMGPGTLYWNVDNPFGGTLTELGSTETSPGIGYNAAADTLKLGAALGVKPNATADWLMHLMGAFGPEAPSPDFFRFGPLLRNLPMGLGSDPNAPGRWALDNMRRLGIGSLIGPQNPGDEQDYEIRRRIRELVQSDGGDPHTPQTELESANPGSPLYQSAAGDIQKENLGSALMSLLAPIPGSGTFVRTQELQNRAQLTGDTRSQGLRDDLQQMFGAPLSGVSPAANVYRGVGFQRPSIPELNELISGHFNPTQQDPRTLALQYLSWAQASGINPNQVWDRSNIQKYYQMTEMNRRLAGFLRQGVPIPLGLSTGPGR